MCPPQPVTLAPTLTPTPDITPTLSLIQVYFFGLIDVLEKFTIRWRVQRACLRLFYALSMRWTSADGISAMPPALYADRFRTFLAFEVLQTDVATASSPSSI